MKFDEVFQLLVNNYGLEVLDDYFKTRSILCDLIGNDIYNKKLISVLDKINKNINIKDFLIDYGIENGRKEISKYYKVIKMEFTKQEFIDSVNGYVSVLFPNEYKELNEKKKQLKSTNSKIVVEKAESTNNLKKLRLINKTEYDSIKITAKKTNLYIYSNYDKNSNIIKIYKNRFNYFDFQEAKINNRVLEINLSRYNPKEIYITIPNKLYKNIEVNGNNIDFNIDKYNDKIGKIKVESLKLKTINSNISIDNFIIDNLEIQNDCGIVDCCGNYGNIDIKNDIGDINLSLDIINRQRINIKTRSSYSKILIDFLGKKTHPKITRLLIQKSSIVKAGRVDNCYVNFDLYTYKGKIKVL